MCSMARSCILAKQRLSHKKIRYETTELWNYWADWAPTSERVISQSFRHSSHQAMEPWSHDLWHFLLVFGPPAGSLLSSRAIGGPPGGNQVDGLIDGPKWRELREQWQLAGIDGGERQSMKLIKNQTSVENCKTMFLLLIFGLAFNLICFDKMSCKLSMRMVSIWKNLWQSKISKTYRIKIKFLKFQNDFEWQRGNSGTCHGFQGDLLGSKWHVQACVASRSFGNQVDGLPGGVSSSM